MSADPNVTRWAPIARAAAAQYHVPASLLLADIEQESGGNPAAVSSAGAFGLTQFIPSTAARYGVRPGTSTAAVTSQIFGQARYLASMGAASDPTRALEGYYAGTPGSSAGAGYAASVMAMVPDYAAYDHGLPAGTPALPTGGASSSSTSSSGGGSSSLTGGLGGFLLKALLTLSFLGAGMAIAGVGVRSTLGSSKPKAASA